MPMAGSIVVDTNAGENALYEALVRRFDGSTVTRRKLDVGDVMLSAESGMSWRNPSHQSRCEASGDVDGSARPWYVT